MKNKTERQTKRRRKEAEEEGTALGGNTPEFSIH